MAKCTCIRLKTVDQRLTVVQQPILSSGDVGTVRVEYELDSYWEGYTPSGTFYTGKRPEDVYEQPLTDGACVVPWEALQEDGVLYIGLRGVDGSGLVKTAAPVRYRVEKGSPCGTGTTTEPTPDVYQLLLVKIGNAEATAESAEEIAQSVRADADAGKFIPVKGVNYYTPEEAAAFQEENYTYIQDELAKRGQLRPEFANSLADCADTTKLYVLPDGYIYAYIKTATFEENNEYNSATVKYNKRLNSSNTEKDLGGSLLTDYIAVEYAQNYPVTIKGIEKLVSNYSSYFLVDFYTADKTHIGQLTADHLGFDTLASDGTLPITFNLFYKVTVEEKYKNAKYVRIKLGIAADGTSISASNCAGLIINFEPKNINIEGWQWASTGHAFVPADYEGRVIAVEKQAAQSAAELSALTEQVQDLATGSGTVTVPDYWQTAFSGAVSKVKALQDEGGSEVVSFVLFSDLHYLASNNHVKNVGMLCAAFLDECDIPLALLTGDTVTQAALETESALLECLDGANDLLAPIGSNRLLQIRGNHDDVWGSYTSGSNTTYYVNKVAPGKIYNKLHRKQAADFRRVFGGDGTYFYLDNVPQKVRFICLNGHHYDGGAITNGTSKAMTDGFGADQLAWLRDEALAVDPDVSVVIATHIPPTAQTINGNTYFLSLYSDGAAFQNIIASTTADIIAIFCGHCHADAIVTDPTMGCKVVTVTCATNTPYDADWSTRVAGSDTETAMDVVSINKAARKINLTRLGFGNDRSCNY